MRALVSFIAGLLFAIGLGLSGMTQPQKIIDFLDFFGDWDPSLLFVMIGAIAVHGVSYVFIKKRASPILAPHFNMPTDKKITPSLLLGSSLFGLGWGISGFCPGPALVSLFSFQKNNLIFFSAMILGMFLFRFGKSLTIKP